MKLTIATALLASATAFVPQTRNSVQTTALANDLFNGDDKPTKKEMSKALPFVPRPKLLDGTLAGDVGFDPFGFAGQDMATLAYMREAEIKHSRLAMLAVIGWPLAELFDKPIAQTLNLPIALTRSGTSPSILNGGLDKIDVAYWIAVVALAGIVELENSKVKEESGKNYQLGDVGFDPLGLYPKDAAGQKAMQTKELKHGRLAMMAVLGFVVQEALYRTPVVETTPFFFHPLV